MKQHGTHCSGGMTTDIQNAARGEALKRFLDLQAEGYLPIMCEGGDGRYAVCYDAADRQCKFSIGSLFRLAAA